MPSGDGANLGKKLFSDHRIRYKFLGDGNNCQNKLFLSISFEISPHTMETIAVTSFLHTIGFSLNRWAMENLCQTD